MEHGTVARKDSGEWALNSNGVNHGSVALSAVALSAVALSAVELRGAISESTAGQRMSARSSCAGPSAAPIDDVRATSAAPAASHDDLLIRDLT